MSKQELQKDSSHAIPKEKLPLQRRSTEPPSLPQGTINHLVNLRGLPIPIIDTKTDSTAGKSNALFSLPEDSPTTRRPARTEQAAQRRQKALELHGTMQHAEIAKLLGIHPRSLYNYLRQLREEGFLEPREDRSSEKPSPKQHPVFTREQEQLLFRSRKEGKTIEMLLQDPTFMLSIPEKKKKQMGKILAYSETIDAVIIACNHNMVRKEVQRMAETSLGGRVDYQELLQAGEEGLIVATKKFDPERGVRFYSYAAHWITHTIRREIQRQLGISRGTHEVINKALEAAYAYKQLYNKPPTSQELTDLLLYTTTQKQAPFPTIDKALAFLESYTTSATVPLFEDSRTEKVDTIAHTVIEVRDAIEEKNEFNTLYAAMDKRLTIQEREIVTSFFGMRDTEKQSLDSLAQARGITEQQVLATIEHAYQKLWTCDELKQQKKQRAPVQHAEAPTPEDVPQQPEGNSPEQQARTLYESFSRLRCPLSMNDAKRLRREMARTKQSEAVLQWIIENHRTDHLGRTRKDIPIAARETFSFSPTYYRLAHQILRGGPPSEDSIPPEVLATKGAVLFTETAPY